MQALADYISLKNSLISLVFDCRGRLPALLYFGKRLNDYTTPQMLATLATRQEAKCSPAIEPPVSLMPSHGDGFTGAPGIEVMGDAQQWAVGFTLNTIEQTGNQVRFFCDDSSRGLRLELTVTLDDATGVASFSSKLSNQHSSAVNVNYLAAPSLLLPEQMVYLKSFEGRWSNEFQHTDHRLFLGSYLRENRRGKTSHDSFPGFITFSQGCSEQSGECLGFHLGTSGNHKLRVELMTDGRSYAQMGELLFPGEVELAKGQSYQSPVMYVGHSCQGFSGLSQQFHRYIRNNILAQSKTTKVRPVHYNTWEGIYFDHDIDTLMSLADKVAELGVERFVLDDGWFTGRRNDHAGLGDWRVDKSIYPEGLAPLIQHVHQAGMEFGIWLEPEMVNPDSDLFLTHSEWVLTTDNNPQVPFRNQYVLDLSNPDVTDYLYQAISDLLTEYPQISYIKWDMNRDVNHPGNSLGQPAMSQHIKALYKLLQRIKRQFPALEIESCCSGGGRVDLGILPHTDRFWTSDSNDALDRLSIQRGFSFFFPSDVMGAHVGPRDCHITGRNISIETRCAVALFGHMGIEMDPRELTMHESRVLKQAIALYKSYRHLIHTGDLYRLDDNALSIDFGIVAADKSEALFAYNSVKETPRTTPGRLRFTGLLAAKQYRIDRIWPDDFKRYSESILDIIDGQIFSGEALMSAGMQLPVLFPQTSLIFRLQQLD